MKKSIYALALLSSIFVACTGDLKDEIKDLEDQIESSGISEFFEIEVSHQYSYNADNPISEVHTISGNYWSEGYIQEDATDDNLYYVYIYSEDFESYIETEFEYNISTEEVILDDFRYSYYDNIYGDGVYIRDDGDDFIDTEITVSSFDATTGEISITINSNYTGDFADSEYDTDGELTASFNETLKLILREPTTAI